MTNQDLNEASGSVQNESCGLNMFFKCILKHVINLVLLDPLM